MRILILLRCFSLSILICIPCGTVCTAQKEHINPNIGVRNVGVVPTAPNDKMSAIDRVIERSDIDWKSLAQRYKNYMDVDSYSDENVQLPILIGMRVSDGMFAVHARNGEVLNASVTDIESIAARLGVSEWPRLRAGRIKNYANKGKWNRAYLELGFLQKDIIDTMAKEGNKDRRWILIISEWLQSTEMISSVILDNYSDAKNRIMTTI